MIFMIFFDAVSAGNFPAGLLIRKAAGFQDGHAGYSGPLDEQTFLVKTINFLECSPNGKHAYHHRLRRFRRMVRPPDRPIVSQSDTVADVGPTGSVNVGKQLCGTKNSNDIGGRCGYGPRLPLLAISPYARKTTSISLRTDQSSIIAFIEDNWGLPRLPNLMDSIADPITNMLDLSKRVGLYI